MRKLRPIGARRRDDFNKHPLSHLRKRATERKEDLDVAVRKQWDQLVKMLDEGRNYPSVKRLQEIFEKSSCLCVVRFCPGLRI